jgi:hypothetical protein
LVKRFLAFFCPGNTSPSTLFRQRC